jgi:hypothetical protein
MPIIQSLRKLIYGARLTAVGPLKAFEPGGVEMKDRSLVLNGIANKSSQDLRSIEVSPNGEFSIRQGQEDWWVPMLPNELMALAQSLEGRGNDPLYGGILDLLKKRLAGKKLDRPAELSVDRVRVHDRYEQK